MSRTTIVRRLRATLMMTNMVRSITVILLKALLLALVLPRFLGIIVAIRDRREVASGVVLGK